MVSLTEQDRLSLRYLCDRSFYHFVKIVGGAVNQGGDISEHIHGPLCRFAQDRSIKRKAIFMPRDWRKSTAYTKWRAIWEYLQNNEIRIMLVSENQDIGKLMLDFIARQATDNVMLRWLYPELEAIDAGWTRRRRWSATQLEFPRVGIYSEPTMCVLGVGAAAQSRHVDLILMDDLVGKKAMESPVVLEGVLMWFNNISELLVNPGRGLGGSEVSLVGTFWAPGDLGTYIVEKCPEFHVRIVPALKYTGEEVKDTERVKWVQSPDAHPMETNFPEAFDHQGNQIFSTQHYIDMLANPEDEIKVWAQHMNMPHKTSILTKFSETWYQHAHFEDVDDPGGVGPTKRYIVCDSPPRERHEQAAVPLYMIIDPGGFSEMKLIRRGSRNAIVIGGQPPTSEKKFIVDAWAGRLKEPSAFIEKVFEMFKAWRPRHCYIETVGQAQYIKKDIIERAKKAGIYLPISSCPPSLNENAKDDRIAALIPRLQNGEIVFLNGCGFLADLKTEFRTFPNSITKDLVDCCGWLNQLCWRRGKPGDLEKVNAERLRRSLQSRSAATGY